MHVERGLLIQNLSFYWQINAIVKDVKTMINNFDFNYETEMQKKDAARHQLKIERDIFFRKVFKDVT